MSRTTLDIIELAGFNYNFNALTSDPEKNALMKSFSTIFKLRFLVRTIRSSSNFALNCRSTGFFQTWALREYSGCCCVCSWGLEHIDVYWRSRAWICKESNSLTVEQWTHKILPEWDRATRRPNEACYI
ncbi:hypothetical protein BYT27DRAFT_7199869 [Phlegmacium glaucopus]|nr:hypothetical protein BYT27DRAFT_7199869 [Phlegmacium glaucopus]